MEELHNYVELINSYSLAESYPPQIVVIDDETSLTAFLAMALREEGYEVQVAYDGRSGLDLIKTIRPQLVISDIMLPLMSGLDVVLAMSGNPELASIPAILISAGLRLARLDYDPNLREVDFVAKPFDLQTMLDLVECKLRLSRRVA